MPAKGGGATRHSLIPLAKIFKEELEQEVIKNGR
jgi:hypothetical protein